MSAHLMRLLIRRSTVQPRQDTPQVCRLAFWSRVIPSPDAYYRCSLMMSIGHYDEHTFATVMVICLIHARFTQKQAP